MSIYENPTVITKPEYKYLFDIARDNRDDICNTIFDKESIKRLNAEYGILGEENFELAMSSLDEIKEDTNYTDLCCVLYTFMKNDVCPYDIKPVADKSQKSEFALMVPFFACASDFCDDAIKRGVDKEILSATLSAVDMYITANQKRMGMRGTSGYHAWLPRYAMGKLFRIGQFQFEVCNYDGNDLISVHIPRGTVLDVRENLINFREALDFLKKYYSEYDFKAFWCSSWLINPHLEKIMGRATNITRFGDMFIRYKETQEEGVYSNVYGMSKPDNLDELPEETSLQRNIKNHLKGGNSFKDYRGYTDIERFYRLLSQVQ